MKKLFPIILAIALLVSSCTFKDIELVEMNNFKIIEFSEKKAQAEVVLTLKNSNNFAVTLSKVDVELMVNDSDVGKIKLDEKIRFPKNSTTTKSFIINGDYDKIQKNLMGNAFSIMLSKKIKLSGKGYVKGKAMMVGKKVDVDFNKTMNLKDLNLGF